MVFFSDGDLFTDGMASDSITNQLPDLASGLVSCMTIGTRLWTRIQSRSLVIPAISNRLKKLIADMVDHPTSRLAQLPNE